MPAPAVRWDDYGMRKLASLLFLLASLTFAVTGASGAAAQSDQADPVLLVMELGGVVDPFTATHVERRIGEANQDRVAAVLITIDTPGGLDSSMRKIVKAILASRVPVICFVAPEGARAASAGTFILLSCPVAAMAPGTNVGAAHPVGVSGAINLQKAENDAAAYIRSLAELRGRNADWAESAVRRSVSASAQEALELDVIDLVSPEMSDLLRDIDGRTVQVAGGDEVVLATTGLTVERRGMSLGLSLLHTLLDPNIAFIFFWLGMVFVITEFFVPGGVLGVLGGIMLVLAFLALGMLPVQLLGVVLLMASVAFFILELKVPGVGVPTAAGLITLVLGGLFLFDPSVPSARVSPWVIAPVAAFAAAFFLFVIRAAIRMRGGKVASGVAMLLGAEGTVVTSLDPTGIVQVASEEWTAESEAGSLPKGSRVKVVGVEGLRLRVVPAERSMESEVPVGTPAHEGRTE
jgi:membrane-bound serine protease (ClpP class)